jgi:hypothetical protein
MRQVAPHEVHERSVKRLGLDPSAVDLTSIEAISCLLRRAAGFICPCPPRALVGAVTQALEGLIEGAENLPDTVEATLDALVAYGDLLEVGEAEVDEGKAVTLTYTAPPAFVRRESQAVLLLGVLPDNASPLPDDLASMVEHERHTRRLPARAGGEVGSRLREAGLVELAPGSWLSAPAAESAQDYAAALSQRLDQASPSGEVPGLRLLDPSTPIDYYPGRWQDPGKRTGCFVARRSQAYGADLWCYVYVEEGWPRRFVDLPLPGSKWRGCDDAWRLQAAIDAARGQPQRFRVRNAFKGGKVMDLFSPVPMWLRRRWDAVGEPVLSTGCLFSYRFPDVELDEEIAFAKQMMWLAEAPDRSSRKEPK